MATLTELVDLDSGVASSEATPEGQTVIITAGEETAKMSLTVEEILEVTKETQSGEEKKKEESGDGGGSGGPVVTTNNSSTTSVAATAAVADEEDDDDDDVENSILNNVLLDMDESIAERIVALTEMFPERLRSASINAVSSSVSLLKSSYSLTRQIVWVAVSSSILLFAPVMFELERLNVEEMMKQDRNRLVLGPGSAMSGAPPTPGLMPPPPPTR